MEFLALTLGGQPSLPTPLPLNNGGRMEHVAEGVLCLAPANEFAPRVLLSAGVHGNETAPVELLDFLVRDILADKVVLGCHLMIQLANPAALRIGERYLDYDMNRLFDGAHRRHGGAREAARAAQLEALSAGFFAQAPAGVARLHLDLHTAIRGSVFERFAICPWLHGAQPDRGQLGWLSGAGIGAVLLHSAPSPTYSYCTSRTSGAVAFTLELGKARPFGHNDLTRFTGIDRAIRRLVAGEAATDPDVPPPRLFRARYDIIKHSEAFVLHLEDSVENFTPLPDGMLIAEDGEHRYVASGGEERILFPNPSVSPGLRAGIVVGPAD
ncbi:succinylglutamate desuccinylase [Paludibacterium paludis]|nr:succinylglutamate desuccinylase [Paludibacterium paludis]